MSPLCLLTEDVDKCFILITGTEIIRCAIQGASLVVAFIIASAAVCGCVHSPWREKDVIFSVMHTPALPIGKRWACKELGWLRAQGTELCCELLQCLWILRMPHKLSFCQHQLPLRGVVNSTGCVWSFLYSSHVINISPMFAKCKSIFPLNVQVKWHNKNNPWHLLLD